MTFIWAEVHTIYIPDGHPTIITNEHSNIVYNRSTINECALCMCVGGGSAEVFDRVGYLTFCKLHFAYHILYVQYEHHIS